MRAFVTLSAPDFPRQADAIAYLHSLTETLAKESDLSPQNPRITALLSGFVRQLGLWHAQGFGEKLADAPELHRVSLELPRLCGQAESLMEKWWCRRVLAAGADAGAVISSFWYRDNYLCLIASEWRLIQNLPFDRIVFLGSGAFPLTALLLAERTRCNILCVDRDAEASDLAQRLISVARLSDRIAVHCMATENVHLHAGDLVICASLLDGDGHVYAMRKARVRHVLVRDGEGVYRFCYRAVAPLPPPYTAIASARGGQAHINRSVCYHYELDGN
jgi:hypothetical protein